MVNGAKGIEAASATDGGGNKAAGKRERDPVRGRRL
jgi:hypothetical protein